MALIEVRNLNKTFQVYKKAPGFMGAVRGLFNRTYEPVQAVRDIQFSIEEGELVGFLGPNGAGKTTTLKMLAGLLFPTSGDARVLGYVPWERHDGYRRQFALLLGQKNQLWWDLPARDSLELNGRIYGIDRPQFERTIAELSELLGVSDKLSTAVRELSLGERMKCELIAALLHQPKVLFLDEPTIGLDVVSQQVVRTFLREYNRQSKTTIILTSHYMADIQELCQRVIIIDHGTIFFDGPLDRILNQFADHKIITVELETPTQDVTEHLAQRLDADRYGDIVEASPSRVKFRVKRERVIPTCKALLDELPVRDIDIQEIPIEDIIRRLFQRGDVV
jgi:ABC-2 type transport system ATP-binding protein